MKTYRYSLAATLVAILTLPAARADYSNTVMGLNPIAYYRLNETTPVPADTAVNIGTLGAAGLGYYLGSVAHTVAGALVASSDTAAAFAGGKVTVPYNASMNPSGSFTVEAWINPPNLDAGNRTIVASMINGENPANSNDRSGWLFRQNGASLTFIIGGPNVYITTATSGSVLTAGVWQHVAAVFTTATTNISLLVNGTEVYNTTGAAAFVPNFAAPLILGDRGYGGWTFSGDMDEVALYTNALTPTDLKGHYDNGTNASRSQTYDSLVLAKNPILYYRLDEPAFTPTAVTAVNLGSLSTSSDGNYDPGVTTGVSGVPFGGFAAGNKGCGFNGLEGEISLQLPVSATEFTITTWFKRSGPHASGQALVFNRPTTGSYATGLGFGYNSSPGWDELNVHWNEGPSSWLTGLTPPDDTWCFAAAVYTATSVTVYLDNLSSNINATLTAHDFSAATTYIGWDSSYSLFKGGIDEVALFDYALSPAQVQSLFASSQMPAQIYSLTRTPADPIFEGSTISMTPVVLGVPPFTNQWYKNNSPLTGQTSLTLTINNALVSDSGSYQVVVGNAYGSPSTSAVQVITVQHSAPLIFTQPGSTMGFVNGTAAFSVSAGGSQPLSYQWKRGTDPISGATTSSLTFANVQWGDAGTYTCTIVNAYGTTNTQPATLTVGGEFVGLTLPDTLPRSRHTALGSDGSNLYFTHGDTSSSTPFYRIPQTALTGWTSRAPLPTPPTITPDTGVNDLGFFGGSLYCWVTDPSGATSSRVVSRYDIAGDFWVTGARGANDGPNSCCAVIATDNILGGWMGYYVVVQATDWTNGVMAQIASLPGGAVHPWDACVGPNAVYFIKHWNVAASNGILASFTKTATPAVTYINGMPFNIGMGCAIEYMPTSLFGDGHDRLYIVRGMTGTTDDDAGEQYGHWTTPTTQNQLAIYDLVTQTWTVQTLPFVIDVGSEMSLVNQTLYILAANGDPAPLKMLYMGPPMSPVVVNQPVSQTVFAGQPATFKVGVLAGGPVNYQWRRNGSTINGATGNNFTVNSASYTDDANYDVVVSNGAGTTTSQAATLTVLSPPTFAGLSNETLVLHLKFEGNFLDSSGRGNDATGNGPPPFVPGKLGQAVSNSTVQASGIYNFVLVGTQPDFVFTETDSFSVSFWMKFTDWPNDLPMIGNAVGSTYQLGWVFAQDQNKIELSLVSSSSGSTYVFDPVAGSPVINDGVWHNIVGVVDRGSQTAFVYVDGALAGSYSIVGLGSLDAGAALAIGQNPNGSYGEDGAGSFDDVGIWRRALSPIEVETLYMVAQQGKSFDTFGPVLLDIRRAGAQLKVVWQLGTLQSSTTGVLGPYNTVAGASAPYYLFTPGPTPTYFRVLVH